MTFHVVGGVAIIYGDLPFTVHICTGRSTLEKKRKLHEAKIENWCVLDLGFNAIVIINS